MLKILYVCLGNICRSPIAEGTMEALVAAKGLSDKIFVDSAGTADYHIGDLPDRRTRANAEENRIKLSHKCRQFTIQDFSDFDYIIPMDADNLADIQTMSLIAFGSHQSDESLFLLRKFDVVDNKNLSVPDPYYGLPADFEEKVVLMILDGWGIAPNVAVSAVDAANTPFIDSLYSKYPHSKLHASGLHVGLPDGQMGNSEVGHMNLGAGRIVYQNLVRINKVVAEGTLNQEPILADAFAFAKQNNKKLHLIGLVSDGGVHSHIDHLKALVNAAGQAGIKNVFVHAFTDGRDTDPKGGLAYLADLQNTCAKTGAKIASITGRYYAMDRDNRWERVKLAYDAMVKGVGEKVAEKDLLSSLSASYEAGVTDEFIKPIINADVNGNIEAGDVVLCFNFRTDRGREITQALTQKDFPEQNMKKLDLYYLTMTEYDKTFENIKVIFDDSNVPVTLGEVLEKAGKKQIRMAETEKYPHVTFFFSDKDRPIANLGILAVNSVSQNLNEVEVRAEKSTMELSLDKKVFNVGKDLANKGGNASDILTNIPSVSVDPEGGIKLRGSENVRILIDGKPSGLVSFKGGAGLQSLQANMVDRVEVITNPSARYEAEAGNPTNFGLGANLNYRHKKVNFFINYGLTYRKAPNIGYLYQEVFDKDTTRLSTQDRNGTLEGFNNNIRGDLIPNATDNQLLATAFHRNSMTNDEGGTDNEEFRTAAVLDHESKNVGTCNIPLALWQQMRNAKVLFLDIEPQARIPFLVEKYAQAGVDAELQEALNRIQKRLGEGVAAADLNKDGRQDIIAGYYWFEAPNWVKHEMAPSRTFNPRKEYSEAFMNFAMDVNLDGWEDVVVIDYPGKPAFWFENNKNNEGIWNKHIIADSIGLGNESPGFIDLDGDGRLDILCADVKTKQIVWLKSPTKKGEIKWKRYALSEKNVPGTDRYSHGIGWGDVNMDGINDVVIPEGWFEGKKNLKSGGWPFHLANLGEPCSHMQVIDLNGDGKNDVISTSAHKLGMWWHEQIFKDGKIDFITHTFSTTTLQTHATIMADLDGNGKKELITGKRYLAHNGNDKVPLPRETINARESTAIRASNPVPTIGASGRNSGTAWRCMFEPIKARLASSCSKKGIIDAATDTIWFGAISISCASCGTTIGKSPSKRAFTLFTRNLPASSESRSKSTSFLSIDTTSPVSSSTKSSCQLGTIGMAALRKEYTWRTVQLRNNNTLSTIYDERPFGFGGFDRPEYRLCHLVLAYLKIAESLRASGGGRHKYPNGRHRSFFNFGIEAGKPIAQEAVAQALAGTTWFLQFFFYGMGESKLGNGANAAIAIAAAKDGKKITTDLFNGEIGWVEWQRPGFDLGLKLKACLEEATAKGITLKGIMLGSHGLFTWGDTSYSSYINTLDVIEKCAEYLEKFVNSNDLVRLAAMGTSCPDHFLRTKIAPLVLDSDKINDKAYLDQGFDAYRAGYKAYYEKCKHTNSPAMRDPNPV
ncbi:hypothetical protein B566_EDAN017865, partial [Ephemera danica]